MEFIFWLLDVPGWVSGTFFFVVVVVVLIAARKRLWGFLSHLHKGTQAAGAFKQRSDRAGRRVNTDTQLL